MKAQLATEQKRLSIIGHNIFFINFI